VTLDARFSQLYFCQSLHTLQLGLAAIADLLVFGLWSEFIRGPVHAGLQVSASRDYEFYHSG